MCTLKWGSFWGDGICTLTLTMKGHHCVNISRKSIQDTGHRYQMPSAGDQNELCMFHVKKGGQLSLKLVDHLGIGWKESIH